MTTIQKFLEHKAYNMRVSSVVMTAKAGSGHPTSCLSAADIVSALFFYAMKYDPQNPDNPNNDRFILSKGHASPLLYAAWKEAGVLTDEQLLTYRNIDSVLEGHPTLRFKYAEAATGSLGMGLSIGVGMGLAAKQQQRNFKTYVLLGDGEVAEGSIWEAAEIAHYYKTDNVIAILDCNRLGQSAETLHGHHTHRYEEKFQAFGWHTIMVDGHAMHHIMAALDKAKAHKDGPTIIIAKTFKGHGIDLAENKQGFHGKPFKDELAQQALEQLKKNFPGAITFDEDFTWKPTIPEGDPKPLAGCVGVDMNYPIFKIGEEIPTRKAYGRALAALGISCKPVVSLDAEVKNSTFAQTFEEKFPDRFYQCFIAEQNMVSMAVGMDRRGLVPFVSTFAAFFSRAFDQVRMAAVGSARLRLIGSHVGVSIGQDGPSQMGLEDLALMRSLPNSVVLYPSDAVSTCKLVHNMTEYNQGISYLRTTRMATPVIYELHEEFPIGGCKILRQSDNDIACVVAAGVTLHEALSAHNILQQEGIHISVIDLYSVKPIDGARLKKVGAKSGGNIITVEDHYLEGGLGQAVAYELRNEPFNIQCLAVTKLPRSGKPEELLEWAGINADAIVTAVRAMLKQA